MNDEQLEEICSALHGKHENGRLISSPWLYGMSEMYSLGRIYRKLAKWPGTLPVPFFSDHGVHFDHEFFPVEITNSARRHFTWSKWRAGTKLPGKKIQLIQNPWVMYRNMSGLQPRNNRTGTLVFYHHTLPATKLKDYAWDRYFSDLMNLPGEYRPAGIMVHMHDVRKGIHLELAKYDLPLFSAGNTSSPYFIDRLYEIISNFRYATSTNLSTHSFLTQEFGVDFFLFGEEVVHEYGDQKARLPRERIRTGAMRTIFSFPPGRDDSRKSLLDLALSTDISAEDSRQTVLRCFLSESPLVPFLFVKEHKLRKSVQLSK